MSSKRRRSTAKASVGLAAPAAVTGARTPGARGARRCANARNRFALSKSTLLAAGVVAFLAAIIAIGTFRGASGLGGGADFELAVYQGQEVLGGDDLRFSDVVDIGRPVVLNFWAGNCPPCRAEMPAFQRAYEELGDEVPFLGLDVGPFTGLGTRQQARALLAELGITYPAGTPPSGQAITAYQVRAFPTTILFDANGDIFRVHSGALTQSQLERSIRDAMEAA